MRAAERSLTSAGRSAPSGMTPAPAEIAARAESEKFDANLFGARDEALERLSVLRAEAAAKVIGRDHAAEAIVAGEYERRVTFHRQGQVMEADFSNFVFTDSSVVDAFYDHIEKKLQETGARWWFLVNYDNCKVYPEAWIAYAQRGKRVTRPPRRSRPARRGRTSTPTSALRAKRR